MEPRVRRFIFMFCALVAGLLLALDIMLPPGERPTGTRLAFAVIGLVVLLTALSPRQR